MRDYDEEELTRMIDDCAARVKDLNDWERKFIADVGDRIDSGIMLSEKQCDKINDIWERVT